MTKKILIIIFTIFCLTGAVYLAIPNFSFPKPPPDSVKSTEPSDLESSLRLGYFTNFSRSEVLDWYKKQFDHVSLFGFDLKLPTPLLNYPPEYAETLIRDQTSSTFLQEFVHPLRESVYINGFEPENTNGSPTLFVDGKSWRMKIVVRYVPSHVIIREGIFALICLSVLGLYYSYRKVFRK